MSAEFPCSGYAEVNMSDDWFDRVEGQVDRFIGVAVEVLFYSTIAGTFLLIIVQIKKWL